MAQIFRYPKVNKQIAAGEHTFKVKVHSDACSVQTIVNIPGGADPIITDSNSDSITTKENLIKSDSVVVCEAYCPIASEDEVFIEFFLDEEEAPLLSHKKDRGEDHSHLIIFKIKFS